MTYKVIISPSANLDEYEAYKWYEKQTTGLGEELLSELKTAYEKIAQNPDYNSFIDGRKELRDYLINRFPFLIVYRVNSNTVEVIAVHHAKKHPDKKYGIRG